MNRPRRAACLAAAMSVGLGLAAAPASGDPALAPAPVASAIPHARLAGEGAMRWFGLKIYDARLWTRSEGLDPQRFSSAPFALELRYARSLDGDAIAKASIDEIARMGFGDDRRRARWLDAMLRIFPNVGEGDRLTGVHRPGAAVSFLFNGRAIGTIDDPEFGEAFFSIWLDSRTSEPGLREQLFARLKRGSGNGR